MRGRREGRDAEPAEKGLLIRGTYHGYLLTDEGCKILRELDMPIGQVGFRLAFSDDREGGAATASEYWG